MGNFDKKERAEWKFSMLIIESLIMAYGLSSVKFKEILTIPSCFSYATLLKNVKKCRKAQLLKMGGLVNT